MNVPSFINLCSKTHNYENQNHSKFSFSIYTLSKCSCKILFERIGKDEFIFISEHKFELYAKYKKTHRREKKTKRTLRCLNCKFRANKCFGLEEATHYTSTYIRVFLGNRETIGEFLVPTLNLLVGLTPSVAIKTFKKLMKQSGSHAF